MPQIEEIAIEILPDSDPDLSWLGEYTNNPSPCDEDRTIDRAERGDQGRGEYQYFVAGTEYVEQDYQRMEAYNRGDWCCVGVKAVATVSHGDNGNTKLDSLSSAGLWGVDSDSGDYFLEVANDELDELRDHLEQFCVDLAGFDDLAKRAIERMEI